MMMNKNGLPAYYEIKWKLNESLALVAKMNLFFLPQFCFRVINNKDISLLSSNYMLIANVSNDEALVIYCKLYNLKLNCTLAFINEKLKLGKSLSDKVFSLRW